VTLQWPMSSCLVPAEESRPRRPSTGNSKLLTSASACRLFVRDWSTYREYGEGLSASVTRQVKSEAPGRGPLSLWPLLSIALSTAVIVNAVARISGFGFLTRFEHNVVTAVANYACCLVSAADWTSLTYVNASFAVIYTWLAWRSRNDDDDDERKRRRRWVDKFVRVRGRQLVVVEESRYVTVFRLRLRGTVAIGSSRPR
jgi:hypothetical protein